MCETDRPSCGSQSVIELNMLTLIVLSLLGAAMAVPRSPQRIVGGIGTTIEEYPYMVNMEYGWFGGLIWQQACGASLLTTKSALSAAHCFIGDTPSSWRSRLGSSNRTSGGSIHQVNRIIIHEHYNNFDHDVAIVVLATPAVYSATVQACFIAGPEVHLPDGVEVTSIGWGDLYSGSNQGAEQLQHVNVTIINQDICAERYAYLKTQPGYQNWPDVTDGMFCAGRFNEGGADACQGDSGGPLAYERFIVIGVTSWGFECADAHYPGVNARVPFYSHWIQSNAV